jgi:hypothetical protein
MFLSLAHDVRRFVAHPLPPVGRVRSVGQGEMAMREMRRVGLLDALDYCVTARPRKRRNATTRPRAAGPVASCSWRSADR